MKNVINKTLSKFKSKINKGSLVEIDHIFSNISKYTLHNYLDEKGNFSYENYKKVQEDGNKLKINHVWAIEENIEFLATYLKDNLKEVNSGICHGTRQGKEQMWFQKYLGENVDVFGTEISETALDFPDTLQWDFHEVKDEWIGQKDFVYSNSFDHSYDPEKCLSAWMSCLRPNGLCIIEHTDMHGTEGTSKLDPFGAHLLQMPLLISRWGKKRYGIRDILKSPVRKENLAFTAFLIIEKY